MKKREVEVTECMKKKASEVASIRVGCKHEAVKTKWEYNWFGTPQEHHFIGLIGELSYTTARYGTPFTDESPFPEGDNNDFTTPSGKTVDVKTSTWRGPDVHLKVSKREFEKKPKDIYVLVQYLKDQDKAIIVGYATREDVKNAQTVNYGYEDNFSIPAKKLRSSYYSESV